MFLKSLYLRNFRNYSEAEITFSPQINLFFGDNAQGKTNLLEAIHIIATGRSFRTPILSDLIRSGETFFFLEGVITKEGFDHKVQITFDGKTKKLILDNNQYGTLQHLLGLMPTVLFTPNDSELVDGSPAVRRRFMNFHLAQANPLYMHHLSRYWRAMKQRNTLLRLNQISDLECWEMEMAESAIYLRTMRESFLSRIETPLKHHSQILSDKKEEHKIEFQSATPPTAEAYLAQLKKNQAREKVLGSTLTGPHRDDFQLTINGAPSKGFCSEGQKKTSAFALRLSEWDLFADLAQVKAVLSIDDIGLHLDPTRLSHFKNSLSKLGQVFITSPLDTDLPNTTKFSVRNGSLTQLNR